MHISSKYDILNLLAQIDSLVFFNINDDLGVDVDLKVLFALEDMLESRFNSVSF